MATNSYALPQVPPQIPEDNRILYYERDRNAYRFLSHFWPSQIELDGESWPTVEQYYQAQKSEDPDYRSAIRNASRPGRAKQLAAPPDSPRRLMTAGDSS